MPRPVLRLLLVTLFLGAPTLHAVTDAEMEACLADGEILKGWETLTGFTKSLKLTLQCDGWQQKAAFKSLDIHMFGDFVLEDGSREFNFSDCYEYEVAAYLLDRELGLEMVPVAVLRKHRGSEGAMIAWIPDTVHEDRVTRDFNGVETASLTRQKSIVRLFDSLLYNVDRRPPNTLVDEANVRVYMIDHGRTFREKKKLREEFVNDRVWLSKDTYHRLEALDEAKLNQMLEGLVTKGQIKTLLKRQELIIDKIDRDRQEYGDEAVFIDPVSGASQ